MYRICIVCSGNICRSPIAEVVLRSQLREAGLADAVSVCSAGIGDWHVGHPADPRALAALTRRGYDGSAHQAQQFNRDWYGQYDLILAADRSHVRALHTLAPDDAAKEKVVLFRALTAPTDLLHADIDDPYYGSPQDFDECLRVIEAASPAVVEHVRRALSAR